MFSVQHVWLIASVHCQTKSSQTFIETFHGRKSMCKTFTDDFTTRKPFQRIADIKCQLQIEIMYHIIQCYKIVLSILMQVKQIFTFIPKTNIVMKTLENSLVEIFGWFSDSRLATLLKSSPWKNFFWKYFKLSMTGACSWWSYSILTKSKILVLHQNFDHWVWWHHHWSFSSSVVRNIWSWKVASCIVLRLWITARKVSKYRVFSGPYFPIFGMNTDQRKLRIWTLFT